MIISYKYKFIFIHLHKCAGTSITKALIPYLNNPKSFFRKKDVVMGCTPEFEKASNLSRQKGSIHKHSSVDKIKEYVGKAAWKRFFVFTFVRNPWDLVLSKYYWWHKTSADWSPTAKQEKEKIMGLRFPEYVKYIGNDYKETMLSYLSVSDILKTKTLTLNDIGVDFIGRVENLQNDFNEICREKKLPMIHLPKANTSSEMRNGRRYQEFYDDDSRKIIETLYAEDIKMFGYRFDD